MYFEVILAPKLSRIFFSTNRTVRFSCPHTLVKRAMHSFLIDRRFNDRLLFCNLNADFVNSFSIENKSLIKYATNLFKKYERLLNDKKGNVPPEGSEKQNEEPPQPPFPNSLIAILLILSLIMFLFAGSGKNEFDVPTVSWSEFQHQMLSTGEVESITVFPGANVALIRVHDGAIIRGRPTFHKLFKLSIVNMDQFEQKLREAETSLGITPENSIPVIYNRSLNEISQLLTLVIFISLLALLVSRTRVSISSNDIFGRFNQLSRAKFTVVDPLTGAGKGVRFEDVAGLKEAKVEVMEFVDYLKNQQKYSKLGAKVPKGALLLGPPGCGKTLLAKAVATEANVPFLAMAGPEFVEMIGGLGAARVRDLFYEAKKRAPCIVYIDEIDAIGRKRASGAFGSSTGEEEQTLNQLLVEMDGMAEREGVILLASTNRADVLDKALLRPGRFDRHILIDYPTLQERKEIFEQHLKGLKLEKLPTDYSKRLSQLTPGFSGADIANVCNEAALNAAKHTKKQVSEEDFEYAVERVIGGTEKRSHVMSPEERKVIAYHECGHALVGWLLKHTDALLKVTIVPRTSNVLGFAQYLPSDQYLYSKEELFDKMCMALGGRVAESLTFNKISSGAKDDLEKVTKMAYAQIRQYGMDPVIGHLSFPGEEDKQKGLGKRPFSKKLTNIMDIQARQLVANAYKATEMVLTANKKKLKLLAEQLLKSETLNYSDIEKLIGPPPFGRKKIIEMLDLGPMATDSQSEIAGDNGNNGSSDAPKDNGENEQQK